MPKPGDAVLYTEAGRDFLALVSHVHSNIPTHLGKNAEPLLDLVIVDDQVKPIFGSVGRDGMIRKITDAVHESHKFDAHYRRHHGLLTDAAADAHAGAGRWSDLLPFAAPQVQYDELEKAQAQAFADQLQAQLQAQGQAFGAGSLRATGPAPQAPSSPTLAQAEQQPSGRGAVEAWPVAPGSSAPFSDLGK